MVAVVARLILVVMASLASTMGRGHCPRSAPIGASAAPTCRSLAWRSPVGRSPPIPGEVSPDQVENGG
jgi:hypothetical protein